MTAPRTPESSAPTRRGVLFDVDGTLIDSSYLHTVAWWHAFNQAGHDVPMHRIHRLIGMGSEQLIDELAEKLVDIDDADVAPEREGEIRRPDCDVSWRTAVTRGSANASAKKGMPVANSTKAA